MGELMNVLFTLSIGVVILLFPQKFTKHDLSLEENQNTAKLLRLAGFGLVAAAILLFVSSLLG